MVDPWDWDPGDDADPETGTADDLAALADRRTTELRCVVDAVPDMLLKLGPDGHVEFANEAFEETLGFSPEQVAGDPLQSLLATSETDGSESAWIEARLAGEAGTGEPPELPFRTADGSVRHVRLSWSALDDGGGAVCVARDVSERRQRERELAQYRELIQTVGDPMYVLDAEGRIERVNDAMTRYTGYERDELVGRAIDEVVLSREYDRATERLAEEDDPDEHDSETFETALVSRDGELLRSEAKVTALTDEDGEYAGSVGVLRDIRERKRRERDLRLLKRVLTRVFRHNVRNELSVVLTNTELIDAQDGVDLSEYTEPILDTCQRLLAHSEKARSLERVIETDTLRETDLAPAVRDLVESVREDSPDVMIDVDVSGSARVVAHPEIEKAIRELLENAVRHAPPGDRPRIEIWTDETEESLTLFIEDESGGLGDHERTVLQQGRENDLEHGSGVGLWLVRWIVEYSDAEMIAHRTDEGSLMGIRFRRADRHSESESSGGAESLFASPPVNLQERSPDRFHGETVVGRRDELGRLEESYEAVQRTGGHVVLVTGDAGVGKTTLVEEFREQLGGSDDRPLIATGRCERGTTPPYHAFREVMSDLPVATELQDLLARVATVGPVDAGSARDTRQALFADVAEELRDLAARRPLVLAIEDLHWADQVTADLLGYLIREVGRWAHPILFLGTYRNRDLDETHPVSEVASRTAETGRGTVLELAPFEPIDVRRHLGSILGLDAETVPGAVVEAVHDHTGGNPLFLSEIGHALAEQAGPAPDPAELPARLGDVTDSDSVESTISARIDALEGPVGDVLELGAVVGETVPFDVLRAASDLSEADLLESVDTLVDERIWERSDRTPSFAHGIIRERTLERIDDERFEDLNHRVARAVETVHAGELQEHYGRLATHYDRAGEDDTAASYYRRAGDRAAEAWAHEDALGFYERAAALAPDSDGQSDADFAALLADLAEMYRIVGEVGSSRTIAAEGLAVAPDGSREACRLLGIQADVQARQGAFSDARETAQRQREQAAALDARDVEGRAIRRLGGIAKDRGQFDRAREYYEEGLAIAGELDDRNSDAAIRKELGVVAWRQGKYDPAREHLQRALDIAQELDARQLEAACLNNLGGVAYNQDEHDRADEYFRRSFRIDREIGSRQDEARSLNNLGLVARCQGEYDRARGYYKRSLKVKREVGDQQGKARTLNNLGVVATKLGEYDRARESLETSLELKREIGDRSGETDTLGNLGLVELRQGARDCARDRFEQALDIARDVGDRRREGSTLTNLGYVALRDREDDRAREYFEEGLAIARELGHKNEQLRGLRGLGVVARLEGEHERAARRFESALDVCEDGGDPLELARVRLERARLALAGGNVESARGDVERAHDTFEDLDATYWLGRSHALQGRIADASGDPGDAREHWRTALSTFERIGAPHDALRTIEQLVETCRQRDETTRARNWCGRARDVLADAPDPVVSRHVEWVDRYEATLEEA